jgi:hypothetical protein
MESQEQIDNANLLLTQHRLKLEWNQMVWSLNNLRCGTAGWRAGVTLKRLNDAVVHAQLGQVRAEAAAESVPPAPPVSDRWLHNSPRQVVQVEREAFLVAGENEVMRLALPRDRCSSSKSRRTEMTGTLTSLSTFFVSPTRVLHTVLGTLSSSPL